jgi:ribonuclease J
VKYNRKVVFAGRSMLTVGAVAQELGVLNIPEGITITEKEMDDYPDEEVVVVVTGSQGEPMAALPRMASDEHRTLDIRKGDTVVFSSTPIPGNEKLVGKVMNLLYDRGAEVIYDKLYDVHTSGHACQEELKLMHRLVKPKYFIPVHGEVRHLRQHGLLAEELGMPKENIFVGETGDIMEFSEESAKVTGKITSGQVLVDGLGVGDVGNIVLRDRKHLAEDGLMIVVVTIKRENRKVMAGPDIISRGFVYVRESESLMSDAKDVVSKALENCEKQNAKEWSVIKGAIRDQLKTFLYEKTKRRPMILPIIMEV